MVRNAPTMGTTAVEHREWKVVPAFSKLATYAKMSQMLGIVVSSTTNGHVQPAVSQSHL